MSNLLSNMARSYKEEEKMERHLKNIKVVFADVDNTLLCIKLRDPETGKRTVGFPSYTDWLEFNIMQDAYKQCIAPKGMLNLIKMLYDNGAKIYGLTECTNTFELYSKYESLARNYFGIIKTYKDLIGVDSRKKKILIMNIFCEKEGLDHDEVMFIDDSYEEVMEAFANGYFSMHTTEVLERFGTSATITEEV